MKNIMDILAELPSNRSLEKNFKKLYPEEYNYLLEKTNFLPENAPFKEVLYCYKHNITERPLCKICGKNRVLFNNEENKYRVYCSRQCSAKDEELKKLRNQHIIDTVSKQETKDKIRKTRFEKYGSYSPKDWFEKVKKTKLEKYGDENYSNVEKRRQTNKKKYEKILEERQLLKKEDLMKKYGTLTPSKSLIAKISKLEKVYNKLTDKSNPVYLDSSFDYFKDFTSRSQSWKCSKCGKRFEHYLISMNGYGMDYIPYIKCPVCNPTDRSDFISRRKEFMGYVRSLVTTKVYEKICLEWGGEYDLYIPEKKLAFLFVGLYENSDKHKPKNYHVKLMDDCNMNGIQLIQVFEDEWMYRNKITKSRIKNLLGIYDKTVYARQCEVKEVQPRDAKIFLETTHIQGYSPALVNLGLYFKDELIALMTFSKPRFNKTYEWELVRFCTAIGCHVPGGASRLLRHFIINYKPKNIISYADLRWSQGGLYKTLGFELKNQSVPNYWYIKPGNDFRESRQKYQKHRLKDLLEKYNPNISEDRNLKENGYLKIYDCGNLVFVKDF